MASKNMFYELLCIDTQGSHGELISFSSLFIFCCLTMNFLPWGRGVQSENQLFLSVFFPLTLEMLNNFFIGNCWQYMAFTSKMVPKPVQEQLVFNYFNFLKKIIYFSKFSEWKCCPYRSPLHKWHNHINMFIEWIQLLMPRLILRSGKVVHCEWTEL